MDNAEKAPPRMKGFRRRAVDLAQLDLVKAGPFAPGELLPLVVQPAVDNVDLAEWARQSRDFLEAKLLEHGAILLRGFGLRTVEDFERVALAICPELFGEYGDLPREGVSARVYSSTPYPADKSILFHNESSHLPRWPMRQFFFCVTASRTGGETPLLDCREIYRLLDPTIRDRFAEKGLLYVRNFAEGVDVSWQHFFRTDDRAKVEAQCREVGMECEWKSGDRLRLKQPARAVAKHPKTGEMVFFNQLQLHHVSCLDPETRRSLRALFAEEDLPRNVYYGDGSPIEDEVMDAIGELYWKACKKFPWQEGDIILLDNMLTAHARLPFEGPRKIVVAMGEMMNDKDLAGA